MAPAMPAAAFNLLTGGPGTGPPAVRFEINAELLDPRGRPGGRLLLPVWVGYGYDAHTSAASAASPDNRAASLGAAALHAASPGATTGSAPLLVAGRHLTADHVAAADSHHGGRDTLHLPSHRLGFRSPYNILNFTAS